MGNIPESKHNPKFLFTYERAREMNLAFAHAMLAAREAGQEQFTLGPVVDLTPLVPKHYDFAPRFSGIGSAAAMCADLVVASTI